MAKMTVQWIEREPFIQRRYANFKLKQKNIELIKKQNAGFEVILTDLDREYEPGLLLKDTVICDHCDNNIAEPHFIMIEDSRVYHEKCADDEMWFYPNPHTAWAPGTVVEWASGSNPKYMVVIDVCKGPELKLKDRFNSKGDYLILAANGNVHAVDQRVLTLCSDLREILRGKESYETYLQTVDTHLAFAAAADAHNKTRGKK